MRKSLIVLLAAALSACGPASEKEPNDELSQATPIGRRGAKGKIAKASDVDAYRLEMGREGSLDGRVGGIRGVDFVLSVRDAERRELKRYDETATGGDEEIRDLGLSAGSYFVVVSNKDEKAANAEQEYRLELKLAQGPGREREPNESAQSASRLDVPGLTRGHYFPTRNLLADDTGYAEVDWLSAEIASEGVFLLNVDVSEVAKVDPVLEVYDTNFYKLKEIDLGGVGEGESLKNFGVRGPARYYLRLFAKRPGSGNAETPYEILTELIPYQGRSEFEPNDQRADATPFGPEPVSGAVSPEGDADWYKVTIADEQKMILRAGVQAPESLDLRLSFCDSLGQPLIVADSGGKGQPELLTGVGVTKGEYYLVVSEKSGRKADARNAYTLNKSLVPYQPGLEYEVNDTTATVQPIKIGESVDGYLAPAGDVDHYEFNVYHKGVVVFELAGIVNIQFVASLLDQESAELQSWTAPKAGESLAFERELEPGTYTLRLRAALPEQNNIRDKYSLRLKLR